ncbi:RNA 2'-phosphotransferase [Janthinobacterium sp. RB2P8]|uniref:RNA 2'-phosphotransferase n=1 Tax=Janthinobacterium sp. RB2P8 TaxID=3424191 RepID=UPI003F285524
MTDHLVNTSQSLSLILGHAPEKIGLALDTNGWADIGQLLRATCFCVSDNGVWLAEAVSAGFIGFP